ncbi:unnamed protein product [Ixodes persulcatus]
MVRQRQEARICKAQRRMRHRTVCAPFRLHSEVNVVFVLSSQEKLWGGREGGVARRQASCHTANEDSPLPAFYPCAGCVSF